MELYAAGLNAWGQLYMNNSPQSSVENDTDDIYEFTCILRARTIEHVRAFLSYTAGWLPYITPSEEVKVRTIAYKSNLSIFSDM